VVRAGQIPQIKGITDQDRPLLLRATAGGCVWRRPRDACFEAAVAECGHFHEAAQQARVKTQALHHAAKDAR
jgi:ribosomal protein S11